jgi:aspartate-semialdehyde dehydrogenase
MTYQAASGAGAKHRELVRQMRAIGAFDPVSRTTGPSDLDAAVNAVLADEAFPIDNWAPSRAV